MSSRGLPGVVAVVKTKEIEAGPSRLPSLAYGADEMER
jgi:hypothetical protein